MNAQNQVIKQGLCLLLPYKTAASSCEKEKKWDSSVQFHLFTVPHFGVKEVRDSTMSFVVMVALLFCSEILGRKLSN